MRRQNMLNYIVKYMGEHDHYVTVNDSQRLVVAKVVLDAVEKSGIYGKFEWESEGSEELEE